MTALRRILTSVDAWTLSTFNAPRHLSSRR